MNILKNANGFIELRNIDDDSLIQFFDPTGKSVKKHSTNSKAVEIEGLNLAIYVGGDFEETNIIIGEESFVCENRDALLDKLALLFSKGGASGEGLGLPYKHAVLHIHNDGSYITVYNNLSFILRVDKSEIGTIVISRNDGSETMAGFYNGVLEKLNKMAVFCQFGISNNISEFTRVQKECFLSKEESLIFLRCKNTDEQELFDGFSDDYEYFFPTILEIRDYNE